MNWVRMLALMMLAIMLSGCGPSISLVIKHAELDARPRIEPAKQQESYFPTDVRFKVVIKNSFTREYNGATVYFYQYDYVALSDSGYRKVLFSGIVSFEEAGKKWIVRYGSEVGTY